MEVVLFRPNVVEEVEIYHKQLQNSTKLCVLSPTREVEAKINCCKATLPGRLHLVGRWMAWNAKIPYFYHFDNDKYRSIEIEFLGNQKPVLLCYMYVTK